MSSMIYTKRQKLMGLAWSCNRYGNLYQVYSDVGLPEQPWLQLIYCMLWQPLNTMSNDLTNE